MADKKSLLFQISTFFFFSFFYFRSKSTRISRWWQWHIGKWINEAFLESTKQMIKYQLVEYLSFECDDIVKWFYIQQSPTYLFHFVFYCAFSCAIYRKNEIERKKNKYIFSQQMKLSLFFFSTFSNYVFTLRSDSMVLLLQHRQQQYVHNAHTHTKTRRIPLNTIL